MRTAARSATNNRSKLAGEALSPWPVVALSAPTEDAFRVLQDWHLVDLSRATAGGFS